MKNMKKLVVALTLTTAFLASCKKDIPLKKTTDVTVGHAKKKPTTAYNGNDPHAWDIALNVEAIDVYNDTVQKILSVNGDKFFNKTNAEVIKNALKENNIPMPSKGLDSLETIKLEDFRQDLLNEYQKYYAKKEGTNPEYGIKF